MGNDTQERYGLTWKVTPDMLGVLGANALFEATNPAWFSTLGWTADEIESQPFFEFIHPEDIARTEEAFADIQRGQPILQFVNRYPQRTEAFAGFPGIVFRRAESSIVVRATSHRI